MCAFCEKMRDDDEKQGWKKVDVVDDLACTRSCKFALRAWSFAFAFRVLLWYGCLFTCEVNPARRTVTGVVAYNEMGLVVIFYLYDV